MTPNPVVKQIDSDLNDFAISDELKTLANSRVLITGASGMLGTYFSIALKQLRSIFTLNGNVTAVLRQEQSAFDYLGISQIRLEAASDVIRSGEFDVVIHAASPAHSSSFMSDPNACFNVNVVWARELALACELTRTKFVYLSSGEVYGSDPKKPTSENDLGAIEPTNPRNIYAISKLSGEALLSTMSKQTDLDLVICRLFHTFGPGMKIDEPRIFGALVRSAIREEDCVISGIVNAHRNFLYSLDALDGISFALGYLLNRTPVNVAGHPSMSILEVSRLAMKSMTDGRCGMRVAQSISNEGMSITGVTSNEADNSLLKSTGWEPQVNLGEAFLRTFKSITG